MFDSFVESRLPSPVPPQQARLTSHRLPYSAVHSFSVTCHWPSFLGIASACQLVCPLSEIASLLHLESICHSVFSFIAHLSISFQVYFYIRTGYGVHAQ